MPPLDSSTSPLLPANGSDNLVSDVEKQGQNISDTEKARAGGLVERIGKIDSDADNLTPPKLDPMPPAPKPQQRSSLQAFGSAAGWLAVLGGLLTRHPLVTSLNAAAGVMGAMKKQDIYGAKVQYDQWKVATDNALKLVNFQMDAYKAALSKADVDEKGAIAEYNALGHAFGDVATQNIHNLIDAENHETERARAIAQVNESQQKIEEGKAKLDLWTQWNKENPNASAQEKIKAWNDLQRKGGTVGWQILSDSGKLDAKGNPTPFRYNAGTNEATTLDGQPYTPTSVARLPSGSTASFTPDAVQYAARTFLDTGKLPPLGMSSTGDRQKIINEAAKEAKAEGKGFPDYAAVQSALTADQRSLANLQKMTDAALSFERTANENFDLALSLAPKGVPTNWGPWVNNWIETGETGVGNQNVPQYVMALLTGANEYAKIMSGSTGAQGSTVDSRREAADRFSPYLNQGQIQGVVQVAKQDMANRKESIDGQVDDIKTRIRSIEGETSAAPPPKKIPVPSGHAGDPDGTEYDGSDGKVYIKQGGLMVPKP